MTFSHPDLDGVFARALGAGAVLECRDPNDGQSRDPRDKTRYQYTQVNGILLARKLPPESVGDRWRDPNTGRLARRAPEWTALEQPAAVLARWPLLRAWADWSMSGLPSPWSIGGSNAYGTRSNGVRMLWMKSRIEITGTDWPQQIPCPHCEDWIVWAEAGYVPGYRICRGCHRHWQTTDTHTIEVQVFSSQTSFGAPIDPPVRIGTTRVTTWVLRPNGRRFWPYGGI